MMLRIAPLYVYTFILNFAVIYVCYLFISTTDSIINDYMV